MVSAHDQFSLYDIGCAALVLLPLIITAVIIAVGLMMLVYPVSATTETINATYIGSMGYETAANWTVMRNAASATDIETGAIWGGTLSSSSTSGVYGYYVKSWVSFPTSSLPDNASVDSAYVTFYTSSISNALGSMNSSLVDFTKPSDGQTVVAKADYSLTTFTRQANDLTYASIAAVNGSNNFTLYSSQLSRINVTGRTGYMIESNYSVEGAAPWSSSKLSKIQYQSLTSAGGLYPPRIIITYHTPAPPVSSFTADNETPCSTDTVQFNDTSTNTPTAWDWRWWDNETTSSTSQNPTYQFPPGLYNVRLYASNADGGDWENKTGFINSTDCTPPIFSPIDASFTSNVTCGNIPFTVQFNDTSTGSPTTWNWSFGTGNYSGLQNPTFEYNTSGLFTINFSANNGNTDWMNRSGYIRAVPNWANCPPTPTPTPTWGPEIMPSTDNEIASPSWVDYMISLWWIWMLLIVGYILVKK
jgi:PKD repeat protein